MKRKKFHADTDTSSKSLKTVYGYLLIVFSVVVIGLIVRGIFIYQNSTFNPEQQYVFAVIDQGSVKQIISINPQTPSLTRMIINDTRVPYISLAKSYGIGTDAFIETNTLIDANTDINALLLESLQKKHVISTNMTVIDLSRLLLVTKDITTSNTDTLDLTLSETDATTNTTIAQALTDPIIATENVSIQVINATSVSGLGQRLGRVLTNRGANVVDVTSSRTLEKKSTITYFGEQSYTLQRVIAMLQYPATETLQRPIANIVIILGEDSRSTATF